MPNYSEREIKDWNVRDFHDYLTDLNKEENGVDYVPFGKGPISKRWRTEQGQLKQAKERWGNETVKELIDESFRTHNYNPDYPCLNFGFIYAYKQDLVPRIQSSLLEKESKKEKEAESKRKETEVDDDWY